MSKITKLYDILVQVQTQLGAIIAGDDYYNTIRSGGVSTKFISVQDADFYPFISLGSISILNSVQADQVSYNVEFEIEILGYVKQDADTLTEAVKLGSDIMNAILQDETLGENVWNLRVKQEDTSLNEFGVSLVTLNADTVISITA